MWAKIDMNSYRISNLPLPDGPKQPTTLAFTDLKYLSRSGTAAMLNNLNMDNKEIIHLRQPTDDTDAANKKYVDDNKVDVSNYLKVDGTNKMTGDLNMDNHKIKNLNDEPTSGTDAVNKNYVDSVVSHSHVKPCHQKDQFSYLMSNVLQWTDEMDGGNSFNMTKIADLSPSKRNFHTYNHKVIYTTIIKNSQRGYKYKMGINFYTLVGNTDYTLCIEILNSDIKPWNKTKISVDRATSHGLTIGNFSVEKFTYNTKTKNIYRFMYYHRLITSFKKTAPSHPYFRHLLVDIPQSRGDLSSYPNNFTETYIVAYGVEGQVSDVGTDKVYDYHKAFDIKPTDVSYNVDIDANQKKILNVELDKNSDNGVATVKWLRILFLLQKTICTENILKNFTT